MSKGSDTLTSEIYEEGKVKKDVIFPVPTEVKSCETSYTKQMTQSRPQSNLALIFAFMVGLVTALLLGYMVSSSKHSREEIDIDSFVRTIVAKEIERAKPYYESQNELTSTNIEELEPLWKEIEQKFKKLIAELSFEEGIPCELEQDFVEKVKALQENVDMVEGSAERLESEIRRLNDIENRVKELTTKKSPSASDSSLSYQEANSIIDSAIARYQADIIGLPDYALGTTGGRVERRFGLTSSSFVPKERHENDDILSKLRSFFFFPFPKPAETAINADIRVGNCWACETAKCNLTVALVEEIDVRAISIDHVSKRNAYNIRSAPKGFRVFGVQLSESGIVDEILLGDFHYDAESNSQVQTFITKNLQRRKYSHVKLQIQTNYGNPQYTCLYRFRVHNKTPDTN